jgi:hypothetical protein
MNMTCGRMAVRILIERRAVREIRNLGYPIGSAQGPLLPSKNRASDY